jgi:hypothetical protein
MNTTSWKDIAELLGIAAIVASLIFVGMQLRQDRQIANSDSLAAEQILDIEVAAFIDNRRKVWRKGLVGESLSDDEKVSFDLLAYALFRQHANDYRRELEFGRAGESFIIKSYAFFIYQNPGLRAWFDSLVDVRVHRNRAFGDPGEVRFFPSLVNDALSLLDETDPMVPNQYFNPY